MHRRDTHKRTHACAFLSTLRYNKPNYTFSTLLLLQLIYIHDFRKRTSRVRSVRTHRWGVASSPQFFPTVSPLSVHIFFCCCVCNLRVCFLVFVLFCLCMRIWAKMWVSRLYFATFVINVSIITGYQTNHHFNRGNEGSIFLMRENKIGTLPLLN